MALLSIADYQAAAKGLLGPAIGAFIEGGAGDERTLAANVAAFERLALLPRVLVDVSQRSTETTVLGHHLASPILAAPSAMHRMIHPEGEIATVRGVGAAGSLMVLSLGSSLPVESVVDAATGPVWFQLYVGKDRGRTAEVISRVADAGCSAIVLTVDAPVVGGRTAELRSGFSILPEWFAEGHTPLYGLTDPVASGHGSTELWDPSMTWEDLEWVTAASPLPVVLKGILRPDDATHAVASGVPAIIVSNHGGRQLDGTPATLDALPAVSDAVGDSLEVLIDGGIRKGTDVLKAIALGAQAVLVGRPILWGLAVDGDEGVAAVLQTLQRELELAMALTGSPTITDVSPTLIAGQDHPPKL